ncbi:hypothetical protein MEBOL_004868 [Melittangium boletus DSM 14713]|uniref:Uncharacterized protein n=2 Tax=Melittangium boletus TaxID=83453 RepID=A0A250II31_9BACT|nr:hypothetical protein MEBOL_004868 [Melittangium boletus DSM 14713]
MSRHRSVHVSLEPGGGLPEIHVAGGTATLVSVGAPLADGGPVLDDARGRVRLVPVEGAAFLLLPAADLPVGERLRLTVPLARGDSLQFALTSVEDEVDTEVKLLLLQSPDADARGLEDVARFLNSSSREQPVALPLLPTRSRVSGDTSVRLRSVLRLGRHVFVSLLLWDRRADAEAWRRLRFRAAVKGGSVVALPALRVSSLVSTAILNQHTFVTVLPDGAERLDVALNGESAPESTFCLPLPRETPTP